MIGRVKVTRMCLLMKCCQILMYGERIFFFNYVEQTSNFNFIGQIVDRTHVGLSQTIQLLLS